MLLYWQYGFLGIIGFFGIYLGIINSFFLTIWWWDIAIHFFAGAWAGMIGAWFFAHWRRRLSILECAFVALFVGVAWEFFELYVGSGGSVFFNYWPDTIKDLILDTLGGALSGYIVKRTMS